MAKDGKEDNRFSQTEFLARSALAGGFAGGLAKTAVAPLERVKILLQTHNAEFIRFSGKSGAVQALQYIVQTQGFRGLYQGHTLTLARAIPHAAVGYTVYEKVSKWLMPTPEYQTSVRRLTTGALTGMSAMPLTYPFELIRVRLAVETAQSAITRPTPWNAVRGIMAEGRSSGGMTGLVPFLHFYRGFTVSLLGTVPYRGGIFLVWETLNAQARARLSPATLQANQTRIHLAIGGIAGMVAQILTYPLEVIRRTQQASGKGTPNRMIGFRETVGSVWMTTGWRGFFTGLGIGLIKQVPTHALSLTSWQLAKKALNI
ncbi:mitochondrial carrier [Mycena galericulata]|nr:mitochondrial carrier [Mycena galericulata]